MTVRSCNSARSEQAWMRRWARRRSASIARKQHSKVLFELCRSGARGKRFQRIPWINSPRGSQCRDARHFIDLNMRLEWMRFRRRQKGAQ